MKKRTAYLFTTTTFIMMTIFSGCDSNSTSDNDNNESIANYSSLISRTAIPVGDERCPNGGIEIHSGIDENGNGILDTEEIDVTDYVCNGLDGTDGADGTNGIDGADGTGAPFIKDATGTVLGQSVEASAWSVTILNDQGYIYRLYWNGEFASEFGSLYFQSSDCSGTAYIDNSLYFKTVIQLDDVIYVRDDSLSETTSFKYSSKQYEDGNCSSYAGTLDEVYTAKTVSATDIGIPESITGPLEFTE